MSIYYLETTAKLRCDSENEVKELINAARGSSKYQLKKYSSVKKEVKAKGEVIDEYYVVSLTGFVDSEKEPDGVMPFIPEQDDITDALEGLEE